MKSSNFYFSIVRHINSSSWTKTRQRLRGVTRLSYYWDILLKIFAYLDLALLYSKFSYFFLGTLSTAVQSDVEPEETQARNRRDQGCHFVMMMMMMMMMILWKHAPPNRWIVISHLKVLFLSLVYCQPQYSRFVANYPSKKLLCLRNLFSLVVNFFLF